MTSSKDQMPEAELAVWFALRKLEAAFELLIASIPRDPQRKELWDVYKKQRKQLSGLITEVQRALQNALPRVSEVASWDLAERCFAVILFHYDERELVAIGEEGRNRAVQLFQEEHCDVNDGGQRFFIFVEEALALAVTPSLVFQVMLFCLQAGFCGKFENLSAKGRKEYVDNLSRRIHDAVPKRISDAVKTGPDLTRVVGVRFPTTYYLTGLAIVASVWLGLWSLAQAHQSQLRWNNEVGAAGGG